MKSKFKRSINISTFCMCFNSNFVKNGEIFEELFPNNTTYPPRHQQRNAKNSNDADRLAYSIAAANKRGPRILNCISGGNLM